MIRGDETIKKLKQEIEELKNNRETLKRIKELEDEVNKLQINNAALEQELRECREFKAALMSKIGEMSKQDSK
jgi:FtsZ-binding cell division protein ZapB